MNFDELMDSLTEDRAADLEKRILQARRDYYNGTPTVTDEVFDAWVDELRGLNASSQAITSIGAPVEESSEWKKAQHGFVMGSLDKVTTPEELRRWAQGREASVYSVTDKLDGISIHLRYEQGSFTQAITRGDGTTGEDITKNVGRMKGVPSQVGAFTGSLRGEILLKKSDHEKYFPDYANPRNAASGLSKRYDGIGVEHLTVMVYRIVDGYDAGSETKQIEWLQQHGFFTPRCTQVEGLSRVGDLWLKYQESIREGLDYEIDGLVVALDDLAAQIALGDKDGRPKGATAFKFPAATTVTRIVRIDWQVGASGRITPVAVFEPVRLMGVTITNASVYNVEYIRSLGLHVGAEVVISRANDVIPRVVSATSRQAPETPPAKCPVCGTETVRDGEYLVCPNAASCDAQKLGRVQRFITGLDVKEWGETLLERLVTSGKVKTVPDLYRLDVASLSEVERISEHMAEKLLKCLWDRNPVPLETLLGSLSIPGCQASTIQMVMASGADTWGKMFSMTASELEAIPGLGPVKVRSLWTWMHTVGEALVHELLTAGLKIKEIQKGVLTGKSFCFTGSMQRKRGDLEGLVVQHGGTVKGSVGKGLSFLILADPNSTSSKAVAARKNGTQCLSEADFLKMVGEC